MNNINSINKGKRIINFTIDSLIIGFIINLVIYLIFYGINKDFIEYYENLRKFIFLVALSLYFILFEYFAGKTIGKMITKTKVVDLKGNKPSLFKIIIRTFSRFIPIDIITFFGVGGRGLHDILSRTQLIKFS